MPTVREESATVLWFPLVPAGPIPPAGDPDSCYPYPSFVETARRPVLRRVTHLVLENDLVRAAICPDFGGAVQSLIHRPSGKEVLFADPVVRPVRILPRQAFVAGGIEVSFPISHTPSQIERVSWEAGERDGRACVWVGEREVKFGMHWTVEFSLADGEAFLTQRVRFRNPGTESHPWMSWSNAGVPARADSEFHYPGGPVLAHGAKVSDLADWRTQGPKTNADVKRMTGYFWKRPDANAFGVFTPSLGRGLYHLAAPAVAPGIKLWTYGVGRDEPWGAATGLSGHGYIEIQGGPLPDQSVKAWLAPGETHTHTEFWLPADVPREIRTLAVPAPDLGSPDAIPLFEWARPVELGAWTGLLAAWTADRPAEAPEPPGPDETQWPPSGMERLGDALRWAAGGATGRERSAWLFHLGAWCAARDESEAAVEALSASKDDRARALLGRLLRIGGADAAAAASFRAIADPAFALHPQVVVERDLALAAQGPTSLAERGKWLDAVAGLEDEWLAERRAAYLIDAGRPAEALAVLERARFQLVHQRSSRSTLWLAAAKALGRDVTAIPGWLGEDDLAEWGAYREG